MRFPRRASARSQDFLVLGAFIGTCGHIFKEEVAFGMGRASFMAMGGRGVGLMAHAMEMAMGHVNKAVTRDWYGLLSSANKPP